LVVKKKTSKGMGGTRQKNRDSFEGISKAAEEAYEQGTDKKGKIQMGSFFIVSSVATGWVEALTPRQKNPTGGLFAEKERLGV